MSRAPCARSLPAGLPTGGCPRSSAVFVCGFEIVAVHFMDCMHTVNRSPSKDLNSNKKGKICLEVSSKVMLLLYFSYVGSSTLFLLSIKLPNDLTLDEV